MKGPNYLKCLPPGNLSPPTPSFLFSIPSPLPLLQCILYHILCGRHGACIYSRSRQPVPSIAGCKNNPQVALLWPQHCTSKSVFLVFSHPPSTLGLGVLPVTRRPHMVKDCAEVPGGNRY